MSLLAWHTPCSSSLCGSKRVPWHGVAIDPSRRPQSQGQWASLLSFILKRDPLEPLGSQIGPKGDHSPFYLFIFYIFIQLHPVLAMAWGNIVASS